MKYTILLIMTLNLGCATAQNLKEINTGMTSAQVQYHLGSPSSKEVVAGKEREVYSLKSIPKAWQWILAYPTLGTIFLFHHDYIVEYQDQKVSNYYRR